MRSKPNSNFRLLAANMQEQLQYLKNSVATKWNIIKFGLSTDQCHA